jgi:RNA polymerase sigma-70 factor (ECF subfamily)
MGLPIMETEGSGGTSLSLLDRVRAADPQAWQRLVQVYSPLIFSWCRQTGLGPDDAADVMQDVWHAVSGAIGRFRRSGDSGTFRGWIWTITRNKLRDHFRTRAGEAPAEGGSTACARLREVPDGEPDESVDDPSGGSAGLLHRAVELIRGDFAEGTFQAFWLTAVDGRAAADVAAVLGISVDAVYQAKSRVLRRLREELGELVD